MVHNINLGCLRTDEVLMWTLLSPVAFAKAKNEMGGQNLNFDQSTRSYSPWLVLPLPP
jgi:hypothetical protein